MSELVEAIAITEGSVIVAGRDGLDKVVPVSTLDRSVRLSKSYSTKGEWNKCVNEIEKAAPSGTEYFFVHEKNGIVGSVSYYKED